MKGLKGEEQIEQRSEKKSIRDCSYPGGFLSLLHPCTFAKSICICHNG